LPRPTRAMTIFCQAPRPRLTMLSILNGAGYSGSNISPDEITAVFGSDLAATTTSAPSSESLPAALSGVTVQITDSTGTSRPAQLLLVSPAQVNIVIPSDVAVGPGTLKLTASSGTIFSKNILVKPTTPGLFSMNGAGKGVAAAQIIRVPAGGVQSVQSVAVFDPAQQLWVRFRLTRPTTISILCSTEPASGTDRAIRRSAARLTARRPQCFTQASKARPQASIRSMWHCPRTSAPELPVLRLRSTGRRRAQLRLRSSNAGFGPRRSPHTSQHLRRGGLARQAIGLGHRFLDLGNDERERRQVLAIAAPMRDLDLQDVCPVSSGTLATSMRPAPMPVWCRSKLPHAVPLHRKWRR